MKLKTNLIIVLFLSVQIVFSQNSIALIDAVVGQMKKNMENFQKEEKISEKEGYRFVFYQENKPLCIVVQAHGKIEKNVAWYFDEENLIYTETNWTDSLSKKQLYQEKTYHYENTMIAWINSESSFVDATSTEFKTLDMELRAYGKKIFEEALK